ncbi:hypothetical protein CK203_093621 [Vitis vinifera]|uniref:UBN2 domain-containing protein n=1 Tax=Vitis vinifera TaxID=29760 RepID=A0A438DJW3_VITVI|nr:hypothetical protein CK203_093621 [Vitis vinifera]
MFSRFMVIVNELKALEKTYTKVEKVIKILRSLPKKWETKVTAIQEAKDLTKLSLEELIGSLMTYEINLNNHQRVEENKKSIAFMALTNDDEEEESESESDEDSMEEECTNEDANMCFMALEEHQDEVRTNDYISSVIRQDDFQSGNHKDKSSQGEIIKKNTTSKRSVFQDPSFIRSLFDEDQPTELDVEELENLPYEEGSIPINEVEGSSSHIDNEDGSGVAIEGLDVENFGFLVAHFQSPYSNFQKE